jgi:hypothetical protein
MAGFQHYGVYRGMAPLDDETMAALAVRENPFLAEMMKRRDSRAWEQAQAIDAARNAPIFPTVPGNSPQSVFQNQMIQALTNSWKSANPAAQKWAAQGFESVLKDISGNTVMTQEQKNAFGASPNDVRAAEELIRRQIDPSFALNVASNNRIKETGYDYGQKRGFENLQLGNKGKLWNLENHGFLAEAPKRIEDVPKTPTTDKTKNAPSGYQWKDDGTLTPIPGGPADKLGEKQKAQVVGIKNLNSAAQSYINELDNWSNLDLFSPDKTARMGLLYNNMMLQAKEAYNLGVLNGPDYEILTSIVRDPVSFKGSLTSNEALKSQAKELKKMMANYAGIASDTPYSNATDFKGKTSGETGSPMTFKSEDEFNNYATKNNLTKEQYIQEYQKHFGGQ